MRRLPIYFVLDVSESMVGEPIRQMEKGIETIVNTLRQDPSALETVYISLIAFAGKAKVIAPLVDLVSFYPPKLPLGGGTVLGEALSVLMQEIEEKVQKTTYEQRGDWKPLVFLITDGKPTDVPDNAIQQWRDKFASRAQMVAVTLGTNADMFALKKLTDHLLALEGATRDDFKKFIEWVSASVRIQSQHVEQNGESAGISLAKPGDGGLVKIDELEQFANSDPHCVVITGQCSKLKRPYLIKYGKINTPGMERFVKTDRFALEGGWALDDSYFEWSSSQVKNESVNTSLLDGAPPCPVCGNLVSFAQCECGRILCLDSSGFATCPWCNKAIRFDMQSSGCADFDVTRGQG